jgi:hypothetical protein
MEIQREKGGQRLLFKGLWTKVLQDLKHGTIFVTQALAHSSNIKPNNDNTVILINVIYWWQPDKNESDYYYKVTNDERRRIMKLIDRY